MGRIPGFRAAIFPAESIPNLTLVANLGLVLYLFLIGLETDVRFLISNWRVASSVAFGGLALPFGLGCALAWGLYHQFRDDAGIEHIEFSTYMLFIGVAIAITAFPVLCRILTELELLSTPAGIITLSAGVANDVIGWILLALCVALANAGSGLSALWILLACAGYMVFLIYLVRPVLHWLLRRSGSIERGPSQSMIALILLIALASAFFTGIIGVHAIFGGFMVGLILPRENSFAIRVTEKLEDLIGALFLPLYFTLSGLNTNLGLLNSGITWGYVVAVIVTAFFSKIIGATLAARLSGLVWRESFTVGALMSCKGLVELIVLNIGLQAKILSQRTFTIFVVMALVTTFATTPLVSFLYPPAYQKKLEAWKRGEIDWDSGERREVHAGDAGALASKTTNQRVGRLLIYLRLDNMPAMLNLVSLFGKPTSTESGSDSGKDESADGSSSAVDARPAVRAHGLRLIQLTDRDSSVMTVSDVEELSRTDAVVNIFRTVGRFLHVAVSGEVAVLPETRFGEALLTKSNDMSSDLLLLPWSETGSLVEGQQSTPASKVTGSYVQFARSVVAAQGHNMNMAIFFPAGSSARPDGESNGAERRALNRAYSFSDIHRDIAPIPVANQSHSIFMPFFGGDDDRYALSIVLQLCERQNATATVVYYALDASNTATTGDVTGVTNEADYFGYVSTHLPAAVADRVEFTTAAAPASIEQAMEDAATVRSDSKQTHWHNLVVLGRRSLAKAAGSLPNARPVAEDVQECLGYAAGSLIAAKTKANLLIVQAKPGQS
jgi:Kef-type K+ transport system membrane component KefB